MRVTRAKASDNRPRTAPARLKPLDFPQCQVQRDPKGVDDNVPDFYSLLVGLEKGISPRHVEALKVSLSGEVELDHLVPSEYLPPIEWQQAPSSALDSPQPRQDSGKLNNGAPIPAHKDFYDRAKELLYHSDTAFDSLSGKGAGHTSATPSIRLLHSHKFYQHLLLMAEYWDTSKDAYTKSTSDDDADDDGKELYTGRRYGAPHEMPPEYREDTVCAFAELCIWPFRCNVQTPRSTLTRKLVFRDRYVPIQGVTSAICRSATDRQKARRGVLEGPLMGIHCRNTTTFRREGQANGEGREEIMDLLFEVGAALLVAQKRAREGQQEVRPGKDCFWADGGTRRHLGEMGGGKQDRETNAWAKQLIASVDDAMEGVEMEGGPGGVGGGGGGVHSEEKPNLFSSRKRKQRPGGAQQTYLDAKPPESAWESKVEYRMIGKEPGKGVDCVYLLSALNHHVSLVKVQVRDRYLAAVTRGEELEELQEPGSAGPGPGQGWRGLKVERSRWFDLFVPEERAQAMRGVWGATGWLMRSME
ncbi:MAG: hypothetical protein Q9197_004873 [Variospora fuerteventurae]